MSTTAIEVGEVYQRHEKAMRVVETVDDVDARWVLLDYVVNGNPAVEAAFAQPRHRLRARERAAQVVELRDEHGLTFGQIAERLGYASDCGPWHLYRRALRSVA